MEREREISREGETEENEKAKGRVSLNRSWPRNYPVLRMHYEYGIHDPCQLGCSRPSQAKSTGWSAVRFVVFDVRH